MEKIKILFTIPNFDTAGSGKALFNIVSRLDKKYFEPHIACLHNRGQYFKVVEDSKIPIHIFEFTAPMTNRIKGLFQCWKISRQMKKINPHLIHSFHYAPDYSEALAAKMGRIPWIFTKKNMNWGGKSQNGWKLRIFLAKYVIAQNKAMVELFFPKLTNVTIIPRGIDTKEFFPIKQKMHLLDNKLITENDKVIITVANLTPVKGIELLLESFEILYEKQKNIHLLIIGDNDNEYSNDLEERILQYQSKERIHFYGKIHNVKDFYYSSDLFVITSKKESCPVALLEAMACGLPILASDIPGIREILEPFKELLFPLKSKEILAKKLFQLLFQETKLSDIGLNLANHIKKNYYIDLEVRMHEQIYLEISNSNIKSEPA